MSIDVISRNEKIIGEKIRYINYKEYNYFIYTLNEIDEDGYQKLYMNKLSNGEEDIISELEWEELKLVIPSIVKQIKTNNITDFEDLEISEIQTINLDYSKPFKLKNSIVDSIKKEEHINKMDEELQGLMDGIEKKKVDSFDELDQFLNNYEEELNAYEEELNKIELPIRPDSEINYKENTNDLIILKQELENERQEKQDLQKQNEELQSELNKYKEKLERIKIMIES